jgi:hypothetical protein
MKIRTSMKRRIYFNRSVNLNENDDNLQDIEDDYHDTE